jgi:hypothetical protein
MIYWGDSSGKFSADRRTEFTTVGTQGVTVADVNKDGWLDIVCPDYNNNKSRAGLSRVYWGGPDGFSEKAMMELPTNGGTGSQVADYNGDGYNDILLINHRSEGSPDIVGSFGDHMTDSYIYWGGPDGFKTQRRALIPSKGAHYDAGVDLGNIYDRTFDFDYRSSAFHYGKRRGDRIDWKAQTPHGSSVRFQIRTAASAEGLRTREWTGPTGVGSFYQRPSEFLKTAEGDSWIQYRAILSCPGGVGSPVLEQVSLTFR